MAVLRNSTAARNAAADAVVDLLDAGSGAGKTGLHYVTVDQYDLEKAVDGWWVSAADIDDASNANARESLRYHIVTEDVGPSGVLVRNGSARRG